MKCRSHYCSFINHSKFANEFHLWVYCLPLPQLLPIITVLYSFLQVITTGTGTLPPAVSIQDRNFNAHWTLIPQNTFFWREAANSPSLSVQLHSEEPLTQGLALSQDRRPNSNEQLQSPIHSGWDFIIFPLFFFFSAPVTSTFSPESSTSQPPILSSTGRSLLSGTHKTSTPHSLVPVDHPPSECPTHSLPHSPNFGHIRHCLFSSVLTSGLYISSSWRSTTPGTSLLFRSQRNLTFFERPSQTLLQEVAHLNTHLDHRFSLSTTMSIF